MLVAAERTTDLRAEPHPSVRSQQKLALADSNGVRPSFLQFAMPGKVPLAFSVDGK